MSKERLQELLGHIQALRSADKLAGRLYAEELKAEIEDLLQGCISKNE